MATKYDTNPLDPEFPEKVKAAAAMAEPQQTQGLPYTGAHTQAFPYVAPTEEQTRRFPDADVSAYSSPYSSPYNGQYIPVNYQPAGFVEMNRSSSRRVDRIGMPENILTALPYIPWYIGLVAGILLLVFAPKSEAKVRFHAAQGLAAHIAILVISTILGLLGQVTNFADFGNGLFNLVTMIMLVIFAIKAWKGKPVHIESIDDLTNWLEEKISPKK